MKNACLDRAARWSPSEASVEWTKRFAAPTRYALSCLQQRPLGALASLGKTVIFRHLIRCSSRSISRSGSSVMTRTPRRVFAELAIDAALFRAEEVFRTSAEICCDCGGCRKALGALSEHGRSLSRCDRLGVRPLPRGNEKQAYWRMSEAAMNETPQSASRACALIAQPARAACHPVLAPRVVALGTGCAHRRYSALRAASPWLVFST